ncbi:MAG TPA: fasciclin domain-containing protein [Blastocatellia bacterium]|nr:fasciclin domain-containing protein [Blastocatellia bacterium]
MKNILHTLEDIHSRTFVVALEAIGMDEILRDEDEFTVFAPTDAAFTELSKEILEDLIGDKATLAALVKYHIAPVRLRTSDLGLVDCLETLDGPDLMIEGSSDGVQVNKVWVVQPNIECHNGVIHVINSILLPSPAAVL